MTSLFGKIVDQIISNVHGLKVEEQEQFQETVEKMLVKELQSLTIESLGAPDTFPKSNMAVYAVDKGHTKIGVFDISSFVGLIDLGILQPAKEIPLWL